jgi:hypothetical protein
MIKKQKITEQPKEKPKTKEITQPIAKFQAGALHATVWANEKQDSDGKKFTTYAWDIKRSFKNSSDEWAETTGMRDKDIGAFHELVHRVSEYLLIDEDEQAEEIV